MRAVLLSEYPISEMSPGMRIRAERIDEWVRAEGTSVRHVTVAPHLVRRGLLKRAMRPWRSFDAVASRLGDEVVVVVALGSPHMTALAIRLARAGHRVVLDVCDSVVSTLRAQCGERQVGALAHTLAQAVLLRIAPKGTMAITYISPSDRSADRFIVGDRNANVVVPSMPAELLAMPPVVGTPSRFVLPVDAKSRHNVAALRRIAAAVREGRVRPALPIDVYGRGSEDTDSLPSPMRFVGWAPSLVDVYAGNSVVIAPNRHGAGVQNKILEGVAAGRQVVAAARASEPFRGCAYVSFFDSEAQLYRILEHPGTSLPNVPQPIGREVPELVSQSRLVDIVEGLVAVPPARDV